MNPVALATRLGFSISVFVLWGCRSGPPPAKYGVFAMALEEQTLIRDADLQMFRRASDVALDSSKIRDTNRFRRIGSCLEFCPEFS